MIRPLITSVAMLVAMGLTGCNVESNARDSDFSDCIRHNGQPKACADAAYQLHPKDK